MSGPVLVAGLFLVTTLFLAYLLKTHRDTLNSLRSSEDKFARAFHASPDSVTISSLEDGKILEVNRGFEHLTGHSRKDAIGKTAHELNLWDNPNDRQRMAEILRRDGEVKSMDWCGRDREGQLFPGLFSAVPIDFGGQPCLLSVVRDLAEITRTQEALRASEDKFALAFRASPDAVMITALPEGRFLEVNEGFTRITGYSWEEAVGQTARDLELWADLTDRENMLATVQEKKEIRDLEFTVRSKSGEILPCTLSAALIQIEERPALLTVARDISALKRAREAKEAVYQELVAKNDELERFTYTVSHDLKGPLFTIRGFSDLLLKDLESGDQNRVRDDLDRIRKAAVSMENLLDALLELSRAGRLVNDARPVDPALLIQEARTMLAGRIDERGVEIQCPPSFPKVVGEHQRLLQVFLNLIGNAIKFMHEAPEPRIVITATKADSSVEFAVEDNGCGLEPGSEDVIFSLFEQVDADFQGSGVGLALVKRIIEVHGGQIHVESEGQGQGCVFRFDLPAAPPEDTLTDGGTSTEV